MGFRGAMHRRVEPLGTLSRWGVHSQFQKLAGELNQLFFLAVATPPFTGKNARRCAGLSADPTSHRHLTYLGIFKAEPSRIKFNVELLQAPFADSVGMGGGRPMEHGRWTRDQRFSALMNLGLVANNVQRQYGPVMAMHRVVGTARIDDPKATSARETPDRSLETVDSHLPLQIHASLKSGANVRNGSKADIGPTQP
jgi:hypothetical protein